MTTTAKRQVAQERVVVRMPDGSDLTINGLAILSLEAARDEWDTLRSEVARLTAQNARLWAALEYYADRANWSDDDWGCHSVIHGPDYNDGGKTARAALEAK